MSFAPVGSLTLIMVIGAVLIILRLFALYRIWAQPSSPRRRRAVLRWAGLTAAVLLILAAAARPGMDAGRAVEASAVSTSSAVNVFVVVDRSVGSPVPQMRSDITALIDQYPDARFAVISFGTRATVDWPLSDDVWSLRSFVSGLSPYVPTVPDPVLQANAFAARDVLRAKADEAVAAYPGSTNLVFYLGTGDPDSLVSRGEFDMTPGLVAGGAVLGYDTGQGIDQPRLREIAGQLGVPYSLREGQPIGGIAPTPETAASGETLQVADRRELYWLLTLLATALVLAEVAFTVREYHKNRLRL